MLAKVDAPDVQANQRKSDQYVDSRASMHCCSQPAVEQCAGGFLLAPGKVHPWHLPAMPSQEKLRASPTYPVVVSPNPMTETQVCDMNNTARAWSLEGAAIKMQPTRVCCQILSCSMGRRSSSSSITTVTLGTPTCPALLPSYKPHNEMAAAAAEKVNQSMKDAFPAKGY